MTFPILSILYDANYPNLGTRQYFTLIDERYNIKQLIITI